MELDIDEGFAERARVHWTAARTSKVTGGKRWPLLPSQAPELLRVLGLLNRDASMSADAVRKYAQLNHLLGLLVPHLEDLAARHAEVRLLDAACGTSFVALVAAWWLREHARGARVIGIDRNPRVIEASRARAAALGWGEVVRFSVRPLDEDGWRAAWDEHFPERAVARGGEGEGEPRPHAVVALHACDTATDHALALAVLARADVIAAAPCCQAELGRKWAALPAGHALDPLLHTPNLRRDAAATATDALRMLLVRGAGYEVTATEFVPSAHTPKNRLLVGVRRGRYLAEALRQHAAMKAALGGAGITLEALLDRAGRLAVPGD